MAGAAMWKLRLPSAVAVLQTPQRRGTALLMLGRWLSNDSTTVY